MNFDLSLNILDEEVWCLDELDILLGAATGTKMQINIGDTWKTVSAAKINIGDTWKTVSGVKINIGDTWKTVF